MGTTIPPAPYLVTAAEAAHLLACKPVDVLHLCRDQELPAGRIGGRYVIPPQAVRDYARRVVYGAM